MFAFAFNFLNVRLIKKKTTTQGDELKQKKVGGWDEEQAEEKE